MDISPIFDEFFSLPPLSSVNFNVFYTISGIKKFPFSCEICITRYKIIEKLAYFGLRMRKIGTFGQNIYPCLSIFSFGLGELKGIISSKLGPLVLWWIGIDFLGLFDSENTVASNSDNEP